MEGAEKESAVDTFFEADLEFHCEIVKGGGNSLFTSIYQTLHEFLHDAMLKTRKKGRDMKTIYEEHKSILNVIKTRGILDAVELIESHLYHQKRNLSYLAH
jgi:DNA-binding FadR family transcriptional regulator